MGKRGKPVLQLLQQPRARAPPPAGRPGWRVSLRDAEPLGQGSQGAGRGIAKGAQRRQQHGQEDMNPLIGFALAHAEQAPLHHLEA